MEREHQPASGQLTGLPLGVVLVRSDDRHSGKRLTVHTVKRIARTSRREIQNTLAVGGAKVRIVEHRASELRAARSLAALDRRFSGGTIVYDPTGIYSRTLELVDCAERLREALGKKADKVLFDSWRRTLFVVLNGKAFNGAGESFRTEVAEAVRAVSLIVEARQKLGPDFKFTVRIGFEPPSGARVIAVDHKSLPSGGISVLARRIMRARAAAGIAALGAAAVATPAFAMDGSSAAVSTPNFSIIATGGYSNQPGFLHDSGWFAGGAEATVPLGDSFGAQVEGGVGTKSYYGAGGHLFWRDPDWALVGAVVSFESLDTEEMTRYGGEAELYLDDITLSGRGGYQVGDVRHGMFVRGDVGFYVTPNFVLRAGVEGSPGVSFGRGEIEFQPAQDMIGGLSVYADGRFGDGATILAGLKIHFGDAGVSLKDRERHEDPSLAIFNQFPTPKFPYTRGK
jgi:hypothetical protein